MTQKNIDRNFPTVPPTPNLARGDYVLDNDGDVFVVCEGNTAGEGTNLTDIVSGLVYHIDDLAQPIMRVKEIHLKLEF